jgi:transcriptional regulator with XRE-family HTH domain
MSYAVVAERSGVSLATVHRVLAGHDASISNLLAIARALGLGLECRAEADVETLLEQQARRKAERLVGMVQGSAALEGQAVDPQTREQMVRQTVHELLAGSKRKLWAA